MAFSVAQIRRIQNERGTGNDKNGFCSVTGTIWEAGQVQSDVGSIFVTNPSILEGAWNSHRRSKRIYKRHFLRERNRSLDSSKLSSCNICRAHVGRSESHVRYPFLILQISFYGVCNPQIQQCE